MACEPSIRKRQYKNLLKFTLFYLLHHLFKACVGIMMMFLFQDDVYFTDLGTEWNFLTPPDGKILLIMELVNFSIKQHSKIFTKCVCRY